MKNSMKQLFRKPVKALLFFLLMTAATVLVTFSGAMYIQNEMRMEKLDSVFVTVGTLDQPEPEEGGEKLSPEDLLFPGAEYVIEPELRPYYLAYLPEFHSSLEPSYYDLLEVRALEKDPENGEVEVEIARIWWDGGKEAYTAYYGSPGEDSFQEGDRIVCAAGSENFAAMEPGKTYIGYFKAVCLDEVLQNTAEMLNINLNNKATRQDFYNMFGMFGGSVTLADGTIKKPEGIDWDSFLRYKPVSGPFTTQCDAHGEAVPSAAISSGYKEGSSGFVEEVTEGFYEDGGRGEIWMEYLEQIKISCQLYPVLAITRAELLESFQQSNVHVRGRMITREEYDTGAKVCMVSSTVAQKNFLSPGDKITLPMLCALYGYETHLADSGYVWERGNPCDNWFKLPADCSLLNANGELYEPFFEAEYEIVGVFYPRYARDDLYYNNLFLIPRNSVTASDENNIAHFGRMTKAMASFQLPNGTVEEFDRALHEAVPQAEKLTIQYSDMGYAGAREMLLSSRKTALLLLAVGLLAAVTIVALLLYFFLVREKRRTAVERSLGMTKRQCRVSLLSGLLALALVSAILGGFAAQALLNMADSFQQMQSVGEEVNGEIVATASANMDLGGVYHFSAQYSPWAMWDVKGNQAELETVAAPRSIFMAVPLLLFLLVWLLALLLIERSLNIEPIYLLSGKDD